MPLFTTSRDAKLLKHFFKEKMQRIESIEVDVYKLALPETETNLYGESSKKVYYSPIRLYCTPTKEPMEVVDVDINMDVNQLLSFMFLRDDLLDASLALDEGDIIKFDERYYEVDNTKTTQYWGSKNNETVPVVVEGRSNDIHGYNVGIVAQCHLTRLSQIYLVETRSGINTARTSGFPRL